MTCFFSRSASVHGLCELLGMARGRNEGCEGPREEASHDFWFVFLSIDKVKYISPTC